MTDLGTPDILCLQEVRVRRTDDIAVKLLSNALPGFDCHFSLANDPINVRFRGGRAHGVATFVRQSLGLEAEQVETPAWEREGRLAITLLPQEKIALANVYAVNGTDKPYWNHDLNRNDGDRHQFKRTFQARLIEIGQSLKNRGFDLVLAGDWNVSRTTLDTYPRLRTEEPHVLARAHLNDTLMPEMGVVDIFRVKNPETRAYTWFSPFLKPPKLDAARVDFFLVSESLVGRVESTSILGSVDDRQFATKWKSDHVPLDLTLLSAAPQQDPL